MFTTLNDRHVVQLRTDQKAIDEGIVGRGTLYGLPALISGDSIAYRKARRISEDPLELESGVIAHGPQAEQVAERYADLLRRWARDYCRRHTATFRYLPGDPVPGSIPPGSTVVAKRHGVLTVTYP
jgi:protein-L-isoaspartate(D-aspartate) O-methyltransferase